MTHAEINQQQLTAALASLRQTLEHRLNTATEHPSPIPVVPPQMETLAATFGLSSFECNVLLLASAVELDSTFAALCAGVQDDPSRPYPTFSLALACLPDPHWSALNPAAPLRFWRLVDVATQQSGSLTGARLRIDERILHFLTGIQYLDERLMGLMQPLPPVDDHVPSHRKLADAIADAWANTRDCPILQLCGSDDAAKKAIASSGCSLVGLQLFTFPAGQIPQNDQEMAGLVRIWEREAALTGAALYVEAESVERGDPRAAAQLTRFLEQLHFPALVGVREPMRPLKRAVQTLDIPKPTAEEQSFLWQTYLGPASSNGHAANLAAQFNLNAPAIRTSVHQALEAVTQGKALHTALWDAGRAQARPRLDDLAQRIDNKAHWEDLVLPPKEKSLLRSIGAHVRHRAKVYGAWGFAGAGARGLGISALFAGVSGTGKTMAAEVLATELNLDLYRIDLSSVVSKYIGETEKNLRRVFDAAEDGGAILFFDEADALFGKRSEVKDSHDRYANIEVNYLLQRMESYRGLAVLATNMRSALDPAFLRRIRFVVTFPFPDATQRAEIWQRVFPASTPCEPLDVERLSRLDVAGGNIRNIALNAAFFAAEENSTVRMTHLIAAARNEFAKIEKPLSESELAGWLKGRA